MSRTGDTTMPYFVEPVALPSVVETPTGGISPQLQQFAQQVTANLNGLEQRGFHLDHVIAVGQAALLVFKQ